MVAQMVVRCGIPPMTPAVDQSIPRAGSRMPDQGAAPPLVWQELFAQVWPPAQSPQLSELPQLSTMFPQCPAQVTVGTQLLQVPLVHVCICALQPTAKPSSASAKQPCMHHLPK